jgi:tRNA (cmo5U34)-methyltransferase
MTRMQQDELVSVFDQQASGYEARWARMAPIRDGLHFVLESVLANLRSEARVLCVGVGTGAELAYLAHRFPGWTFTALDPSAPMLEVCRQRAEREGFAARCRFHQGYVESLSPDAHDAATCFLVSQFIVDREARSRFFREIAMRLRPGAILASSDLAADTSSPAYDALLSSWSRIMTGDVSPEGLKRMRAAYAKDVAVVPPATVASIIQAGGFEPPVQFFQAALLHAWCSKRASDNAG